MPFNHKPYYRLTHLNCRRGAFVCLEEHDVLLWTAGDLGGCRGTPQGPSVVLQVLHDVLHPQAAMGAQERLVKY